MELKLFQNGNTDDIISAINRTRMELKLDDLESKVSKIPAINRTRMELKQYQGRR